MRDVAQWIRRSLAGERAGILDSAVGAITAHAQPLRQAQLRVEELTAANRRKDEFLAVLSHELRSPLAAIHNAARVLGIQIEETPARRRAQALIDRNSVE